MIRADSGKGTLVAGDNERPSGRSVGRAIVRRAKDVNAGATSEPAGNKINVSVTRSGKVIDCDPLFVFGTPTGRAINRRLPCGPVVVRTEHLDRTGAIES